MVRRVLRPDAVRPDEQRNSAVIDDDCVDREFMAHLSAVVTELANSQDMDGTQQLLASNQELVSGHVEELLDRAAVSYDKSGRTEEARATEYVRELISYCRIFGTDMFFAALRHAMADPIIDPESLQDTAQRLGWEVSTGQSQSLDELRSVCAMIVVSFPHTPIAIRTLHMLGVSTRRVYLRSGDEDTLASAIYILTSALHMTSPDFGAQATGLMSDLGNALKNRGQLHDSVEDLDRAIELQREARRLLATETKASDMMDINLGSTLLVRYRLTQSADNIGEAIELFRQVAEREASPSSVSLAFYNLALAFVDRFENSGDAADLTRAIDADISGLSNLPPQAAETAERLHSLGLHLRTRFLMVGQRPDLDQAVEVLRGSVDSSGRTSSERGRYCGDLGATYEDRFRRYGDVEDHRSAIQCFREAVAILPEGSFDHAMQLHNLGEALSLRPTAGDSSDFDEGLGYLERAAASCTALSRSSSLALSNLASALTKRFETTGDLADLQRAIDLYEQALALSDSGPDRAGRISDYATALGIRYDRIRDPQDLTRAMTSLKEAEALAKPRSFEWYAVRHNLGKTFHRRFEQAHDPRDLDKALSLLKEGALNAAGRYDPLSFQSANGWGNLEMQHQNWTAAASAYQLALEAADRLQAAQADWTSSSVWRRTVLGLPGRAAVAMSKAGDLQGAVRVLERNRAYLLNTMLDRRHNELARLVSAGHMDMAQAYMRAADTLRRLDTVVADHPQRPPSAELLPLIEEAKAELTEVIRQAQRLPGMRDFMRLDEVRDPPDRPVVYLVPGIVDEGVALVVGLPDESQVRALWLPQLNNAELGDRITAYFGAYAEGSVDLQPWLDAIEESAIWSWDAVMEQLVDLLRPAGKAVLVPVGLASMVPWHAAFRRDDKLQRSRYAMDEVLLTYAPTGRAASARRRPSPDSTVLFIADPQPVSLRNLPFAVAEVELARQWVTDPTVLRHEQATREATLAELHEVSMAHFACHATFGVDHPLDAFLMMANDSPLTLRDLLTQPIDSLDYVVLSACDTAVTTSREIDEMTNMATGFLAAGAIGVFASMWAVPDASTSLLMSALYQGWQGHDESPAQALRAAQRWLRDSTNAEKALLAPDLYAPLLQRLSPLSKRLWGEARPHQHPYYWAAFAYFGAP